MKIAVIGSGAIGGLVAGYLKSKGEDISLLGRPDSVAAIRKNGLRIEGVRGDFSLKIGCSECLDYQPELAILATKTQDLTQAVKSNLEFLKSSLILTTENGVRADNLVAEYLPKEKIISSIVMFGSTFVEPGVIQHNFEGSWIIGEAFPGGNENDLVAVSLVLDKAFPTIISQEIEGMKYLKIFVNANNCIPGILGLSMQEAFSDLAVSRISIAIWREAFELVSKAGIKLVSLPGFPLENITKMTSLPGLEAAKIFSGIMMKLSKDPLYGSILQSIKRGRCSEIDYLNGEFVRIARENNLKAPLNGKLVEMVHQAEKTKKFFSKEKLLEETKGLVN